MNKIVKNINSVLVDWNPLEVDRNVIHEEYIGYIPSIIKSMEKDQLLNYLEDILVNKMQVSYNPNNKNHVEDLQKICDRIIRTYKLSK